MRLMSIALKGFRRFEESVEMDVSGDVIALIGPNEAGKSSILDAMLTLNDVAPFDRRQRTRSTAGETRVSAGYVLEKEDQTALKHLMGGDKVKWCIFEKQADGHFRVQLWPELKRQHTLRHNLGKRLLEHSSAEELDVLELVQGFSRDLLNDVVKALHSEEEDLSTTQLETIKSMANALVALPARSSNDEEPEDDDLIEISQEFKALLKELSSFDESRHPADEAADILESRRPRFINFEQEDRDLQSSYAIEDFEPEVPSTPAQ